MKPIDILVVGQTPPPYHGQAMMIQEFLKGPYKRLRTHHLRMAYSDDTTQIGRFNLRKVTHLFELIYRTAVRRLRLGPCYLFYPPAGPKLFPILRDIVYLLSTRWMFLGTILDFHAAGVSERVAALPGPLRWLAHLAYGKVMCAITLSQYNPDDPTAFQAKKRFEIPNAIADVAMNTWGPTFGRQAFGRQSRAEGEPVRLLFVGILTEAKGTLVFLDAVQSLLNQGYAVQADMVGEIENPTVRAEIERRIVDTRLKQAVTFHGRLIGDTKWGRFQAADIFVFPTYFESESFGLVLIEAMQFGVPLVSTKWRGVQSVVVDGETGFLVPIKNSEAVAEKIRLLANDPELAARMGAAGRRRYEQHYTLERFWERMEEAILKSI